MDDIPQRDRSTQLRQRVREQYRRRHLLELPLPPLRRVLMLGLACGVAGALAGNAIASHSPRLARAELLLYLDSSSGVHASASGSVAISPQILAAADKQIHPALSLPDLEKSVQVSETSLQMAPLQQPLPILHFIAEAPTEPQAVSITNAVASSYATAVLNLYPGAIDQGYGVNEGLITGSPSRLPLPPAKAVEFGGAGLVFGSLLGTGLEVFRRRRERYPVF